MKAREEEGKSSEDQPEEMTDAQVAQQTKMDNLK